MRCPHCQSETVVKNGSRRLQDNRIVQYYRCRGCTHNFNDRTGTPMARLRTPSNIDEYALKALPVALPPTWTERLLPVLWVDSIRLLIK